MLDKFELDKNYVFSKEVALTDKVFKMNYDNPITKDWVDYAYGKIVIIEDEYMSKIFRDDKILFIPPWWCKEL